MNLREFFFYATIVFFLIYLVQRFTKEHGLADETD
jgi:hypothetical protein